LYTQITWSKHQAKLKHLCQGGIHGRVSALGIPGCNIFLTFEKPLSLCYDDYRAGYDQVPYALLQYRFTRLPPNLMILLTAK